MAQMTWRGDDELLARVRRAALERGHSMNEYVTAVLDAATDPDLAGDEAAQLRERLAQAGLLVATRPRRRRPPADQVARARAAAGRGTPLGELVVRDR